MISMHMYTYCLIVSLQVKSYLDNNDKGWTFDVQFKRTVRYFSTPQNVN